MKKKKTRGIDERQILKLHPMVVTDAVGTCLFYSQMELIMEKFKTKLETPAAGRNANSS